MLWFSGDNSDSDNGLTVAETPVTLQIYSSDYGGGGDNNFMVWQQLRRRRWFSGGKIPGRGGGGINFGKVDGRNEVS